MSSWGDFVFNEPYNGKEINSINGVCLPIQYLEFMKEHNGGEGDIGGTWLLLYRLEELEDINGALEEFLLDSIIIGSNGAGELYGVNKNGTYFNVPDIIEEEYVTLLGNDFDDLPDKINELWK